MLSVLSGMTVESSCLVMTAEDTLSLSSLELETGESRVASELTLDMVDTTEQIHEWYRVKFLI